VKAALEAAGASLADIVKTNTYVTDIEEFFKHVDVRMEYFGAMPTSTTVEVRRLAHPDLLVEVEVMAVGDWRALGDARLAPVRTTPRSGGDGSRGARETPLDLPPRLVLDRDAGGSPLGGGASLGLAGDQDLLGAGGERRGAHELEERVDL